MNAREAQRNAERSLSSARRFLPLARSPSTRYAHCSPVGRRMCGVRRRADGASTRCSPIGEQHAVFILLLVAAARVVTNAKTNNKRHDCIVFDKLRPLRNDIGCAKQTKNETTSSKNKTLNRVQTIRRCLLNAFSLEFVRSFCAIVDDE